MIWGGPPGLQAFRRFREAQLPFREDDCSRAAPPLFMPALPSAERPTAGGWGWDGAYPSTKSGDDAR